MATLTLSKTYDDVAVLDAVDLSNWLNDTETFLNTTKLNDDNIQTGGIDGSTKIADASISTAKIATDAITTAKVAATTIETIKINDLAVTAAKMAASSVTTAKLASDSITTAKITNAVITRSKLAAANYSTSTASFTATVTTPTLTGHQVTITTTGRPVVVAVYGGSATESSISNGATATSTGPVLLVTIDDSTLAAAEAVLTSYQFKTSNGLQAATATLPASCILFIHTPSAAEHTYRLFAEGVVATYTSLTLFAMEL